MLASNNRWSLYRRCILWRSLSGLAGLFEFLGFRLQFVDRTLSIEERICGQSR